MAEQAIIDLQARIAYLEDQVDAQDLALSKAFETIEAFQKALARLQYAVENASAESSRNASATADIESIDARHLDDDAIRLAQLAEEKPPHY